MNIELKSFKHFASLSEETEAFSAMVYVDGKRAFIAENTGKGESHRLTPVKGQTYDIIRKVSEWAITQPQVDIWDGELLNDSLDFYLSRLVDEFVLKKELKRLLNKSVVIFKLKTEGGDLIQLASKFRPTMLSEFRTNLRDVYPECVILNDLPFDEAMGYYKNTSSPDKLEVFYRQWKAKN
jgi:hypothetical protein